MEIKYVDDGYVIIHNDKTLFKKRGNTSGTGATWTESEKIADANKVLMGYLDSVIKSKDYYPRLKSIYNKMVSKPFVDGRDIIWHSSFDSITRLQSEINLSKQLDIKYVTFYDINNDPHDLLIEEAVNLVKNIHIKTRGLFVKKNELFVKIKNAASEAELSMIDIEKEFGIDVETDIDLV